MTEIFVNSLSFWQVGFSLALASLSLYVFLKAIQVCRRGSFYSDTPWGFVAGIYVWGDALILAPFWFFSAGLFLFLPPIMILRYGLIFFTLRAAYEVIYWLNHQAVKDAYQPPLFRKIRWINSNEAAILYQLLNLCQVAVFASLLVWSFYQF